MASGTRRAVALNEPARQDFDQCMEVMLDAKKHGTEEGAIQKENFKGCFEGILQSIACRVKLFNIEDMYWSRIRPVDDQLN